jgi:serine/threonine protein kinase
MGRRPRDVVGLVAGYRLVRRLDEGGANETYEASSDGAPGPVVVKLLGRARAAGASATEACLSEATSVGRLGHPHIASLRAVGRLPDGTPYVAREYLEGETLEAHLRRERRLDPQEAARLVTRIAAALAAAHQVGTIHGELRPHKIFLTEAAGYAGRFVKIVGFGVWRMAGDRRGPGARAETARFTSPELTDGSEAVDGRTDQFSLAAIAYRMITGVDAFPGDDVAAVLRGVLHGTPAPLPQPALDTVIRRGLARDPRARFGTILEFAAALEEAAAGAPGEVTRPVATAQIVSVEPAPPGTPGVQPTAEMDDEISESFFEDGWRQERSGWYTETPPPYRGRLDRVPKHRGPALLLMGGLLAAAAVVIWWTGWRPPADWQLASLWHTLLERARR